jgi:hypothetical protein
MSARTRPSLIEPKPAAPMPNEHTAVLVDALRRAGTEMGQRWLALLARAAPPHRAALITEVERLVAERYADEGTIEVAVRYPPVQRRGFVEQTETVYRVRRGSARRRAAERTREPRPKRA